MAVLEQGDLGVDVVDGIDHEIRLLPAFGPGRQQSFGAVAVKFLQAQVELDPRRDRSQPPLQALYLGKPHVRQCCNRMPVQATQRDLVEVDQPQLRDAGPSERGCGVAADAATADHDHERVAQLIEAFGREEDAVPGQLLEYQLIVEVAGLGTSREFLCSDVFLVRGRYRSEARELLGRGLLLVISTPPPHKVLLLGKLEVGGGEPANLLQRVVVAGVGDGILKPGHSLLV